MKKLMICLVAAAMVFCATESATAQKIGFGVKGGANLSTWSQDDSEVRLGFHAGLYANIKINNMIAIQPEVLYSMEGSTYNVDTDFEILGKEYWTNADYTYAVHKLAVPLMLQISPIKMLTLEVGPQFGFNLGMSGHLKYETNIVGDQNYEKDIDYTSDDYNMFELGLAVGAKVNFAGNLSLGARYVYGLMPLMDKVETAGITVSPEVKTHNVMISLSYGF